MDGKEKDDLPSSEYYKLSKKKFKNKKLSKENILITAGATREFLDPVRFISNPSSGIMGLCIAEEFKMRGAKVNIVAGHTDVDLSNFDSYIRINTAEK